MSKLSDLFSLTTAEKIKWLEDHDFVVKDESYDFWYDGGNRHMDNIIKSKEDIYAVYFCGVVYGKPLHFEEKRYKEQTKITDWVDNAFDIALTKELGKLLGVCQ